jgi:hypothetical protein
MVKIVRALSASPAVVAGFQNDRVAHYTVYQLIWIVFLLFLGFLQQRIPRVDSRHRPHLTYQEDYENIVPNLKNEVQQGWLQECGKLPLVEVVLEQEE